MNKVLAMVLAGGEGNRLSVLCEERTKPAVVWGGRYRIIDFALSNCVTSGIRMVGILAQYRPRSLTDHIGIGRPWDLDRSGNGIFFLHPQRARDALGWYRGTADAIYWNLDFVEEFEPEHTLILAGDHIYLMDYEEMVNFHVQHGADVTIGMYQVPIEEAHRYGILAANEEGRLVGFEEKPANPTSNLVSMGIYVFNKKVMVDRLLEDAEQETAHDFGRSIIPSMVERGDKVYGYRFDGYWRDVGTLEALWQANMDLLEAVPQFNLYDEELPIRTNARDLPPAKLGAWGRANRSLLSEGCIINGYVENSILSPGVYVERDAVVRDSVIFHDTRIERGAVIQRSILDKEIQVGENTHIGFGDDYTPNLQEPTLLNTGITVIGKRAKLPAGLTIGRNCVIGPRVTPDDLPSHNVPSGQTVRVSRGRIYPYAVEP